MVKSFPLDWPAGWPRTNEYKREIARFSQKRAGSSWQEPLSMSKASFNLQQELDRLGAKNIVLSSNLELKLDGTPYANQKKVSDLGVAVYFTKAGKEQCIPCDKWTRPEDNIQAIAKTIDALRGIERWGAKEMVDAAFRGFQALPSPDDVMSGQIAYFADCQDKEEARSLFLELTKEMHPDKGGDTQEFQEMKRQYDLIKNQDGEQ